MPYQGYPDGLYLVKQRSLTKGVEHYGILDIGNRRYDPNFWDGRPAVIHQVYPALRVDEFEGTGAWAVMGWITNEVMAFARMREAEKNPYYDLFGNNCEHFARFVATGKRESRQLQGAVIVAGVLAVAAMMIME
ncbi:MAG: hypothetical protein HKL90_14810 [Elusimicrobia bacterium]|nr:hypothetical protein [Elusimicrobiota bacterium]